MLTIREVQVVVDRADDDDIEFAHWCFPEHGQSRTGKSANPKSDAASTRLWVRLQQEEVVDDRGKWRKAFS